MGLAALFQAVAALVSGGNQQPTDLPSLTPRQKAALVVVSGLPAPKGVAGVLVQDWSRSEPRPRRALVFVDQEGGSASTFDELPPGAPASSFQSPHDALAAGRATGEALERAGVDVDLAPVLDLAGGPLGSGISRSRPRASLLRAASKRAAPPRARSIFPASDPRGSRRTSPRMSAHAFCLRNSEPSARPSRIERSA